jgi:hypothetical protein
VIECDKGLTGIAIFTYHDSQTGTATGLGLMSDGRTVRMCSGRNIRQFPINESGDVSARLMYGDVPVPIS